MSGDRRRAIRAQLATINRMERWVRLLVAGGLAMTGGLWAVTLTSMGSAWWSVGAGIAVLGVASLSYGIWMELDPTEIMDWS